MNNKKSILAITSISILLTSGVGADQLSTSNRASLFGSQTRLLDGRASQQYSGSIRLQPPRVSVPSEDGATSSGLLPSITYTGSYRGPYLALARRAANRYGIPEDLFLRLIQQESGWNARARSHKGAIGLAQLMPQTARYLRVNPNDPSQNLEGGAKYLKEQYDRFGRWDHALAAYNAGPEAVARHGGIPPYSETRNYVRIIWGSQNSG